MWKQALKLVTSLAALVHAARRQTEGRRFGLEVCLERVRMPTCTGDSAAGQAVVVDLEAGAEGGPDPDYGVVPVGPQGRLPCFEGLAFARDRVEGGVEFNVRQLSKTPALWHVLEPEPVGVGLVSNAPLVDVLCRLAAPPLVGFPVREELLESTASVFVAPVEQSRTSDDDVHRDDPSLARCARKRTT